MALNGEILKAYNNLPAIPIEQPLGDLLNTIPVGDPALENPPGGIATLYVSASGSDDTGDGSQANPYATPQMAIDSIPATVEDRTSFYIQCGAGAFPLPDVQNVPDNIQLYIVGDTSSPVISIPAGTASFAQVPGKEARWVGTVGAYGDTISDGSHWIGFVTPGSGLPPSISYLATASASPSLSFVASSANLFGFRDAFVYEYRTSFLVTRNVRTTRRAFADGRYSSNVLFSGISFEGAESVAILAVKGIAFLGCRTALGLANFFNWEIQECSPVGMYIDSVNTGMFLTSSVVSNSYIKAPTTYEGANFSQITGSVMYPASINSGAALFFADVDFESTGGGTALTLQGAAPYLHFQQVAVDPALAGFVNCSSSGNAVVQASQTITGSVTGNAIVLTNGAQGVGLEAACSGNLTAGGSEIVVGGNAGQTFASLPATDLAAASPQLCRAT